MCRRRQAGQSSSVNFLGGGNLALCASPKAKRSIGNCRRPRGTVFPSHAITPRYRVCGILPLPRHMPHRPVTIPSGRGAGRRRSGRHRGRLISPAEVHIARRRRHNFPHLQRLRRNRACTAKAKLADFRRSQCSRQVIMTARATTAACRGAGYSNLIVSGTGGAGPKGGRVGDRRGQWGTHRADRLACRAGHAFAADDLHASGCRAVIDLPRAMAARTGFVTARPWQRDLRRLPTTCAAHGGSLAEQEQNENRQSDGGANRSTGAAS